VGGRWSERPQQRPGQEEQAPDRESQDKGRQEGALPPEVPTQEEKGQSDHPSSGDADENPQEGAEQQTAQQA
jgi:hypothetical protein